MGADVTIAPRSVDNCLALVVGCLGWIPDTKSPREGARRITVREEVRQCVATHRVLPVTGVADADAVTVRPEGGMAGEAAFTNIAGLRCLTWLLDRTRGEDRPLLSTM